jgi:hypothetical protein
MADQCRNCGADLFYGQRFCRACGKTTDPYVEENAPTQRMPPPPDLWGARQANTAPTSTQETSPVFAPPTYYQPPPHPVQPYTPPQSRPVWPWIVAVIGAGLLVAMILGVIFVSRTVDRGRDIARDAARDAARKAAAARGSIPAPPPVPPLPPIPPLAGAESVLGADNAEVETSGNETVLTKTFTLNQNALVTVSNVNGTITVEASDGPEAELIVTKRGGSEQDREAALVKFFIDNGRLSLRTELPRFSKNMEVRYELKLPRELGRVEIISTNGSIGISDITALISAESTNGSIQLGDVTGVAKVETTNGNIKAELTQVPPDRPMDFKSTNGNIEISFNSDFSANLTAETTHGSIRLDEEFNIPVQKQLVGQQAMGRIGQGGPTLSVKTTNGSIKLTK